MHCDFIYKGPLALDKSLIFYIEINITNALCNKSMQFSEYPDFKEFTLYMIFKFLHEKSKNKLHLSFLWFILGNAKQIFMMSLLMINLKKY